MRTNRTYHPLEGCNFSLFSRKWWKPQFKKMDKCGEGEEMRLGAVRSFEAQSSGKEDNDISVHSWGTRRLGHTTRMGGWGSGGHRVSFHTSSLGRSGSGILEKWKPRWVLGRWQARSKSSRQVNKVGSSCEPGRTGGVWGGTKGLEGWSLWPN